MGRTARQVARRVYAEEYDIPLCELGLEVECGDVGPAVDEHAQGKPVGESTLGTLLEHQETTHDSTHD